MDDNPYQTPRASDAQTHRPCSAAWAPLIWTIIGFACGTLVVAPFILSLDLRVKLAGGATFGGPLGALFGLAHGLQKRRQEEDRRD